jgi:hypothetical protein
VKTLNLNFGASKLCSITESKKISKHDVVQDQTVSSNFSHRGLRSLARLGIAREILDEIREAKRSVDKSKRTIPDEKKRNDQ